MSGHIELDVVHFTGTIHDPHLVLVRAIGFDRKTLNVRMPYSYIVANNGPFAVASYKHVSDLNKKWTVVTKDARTILQHHTDQKTALAVADLLNQVAAGITFIEGEIHLYFDWKPDSLQRYYDAMTANREGARLLDDRDSAYRHLLYRQST